MMLTRLCTPALVIALAAGGAAFAVELKPEKEGKHHGEIIGIDRENRTVTVRIAEFDSKETHVFQVVPKTVIKDKETGKPLDFSDLSVGDRVFVTGKHEKKTRIAKEIVVRREKEKKKS